MNWRKGFLVETRHGLRKFRRAEMEGCYISAFLSWLPKLNCFSELVTGLFPEYTEDETFILL